MLVRHPSQLWKHPMRHFGYSSLSFLSACVGCRALGKNLVQIAKFLGTMEKSKNHWFSREKQRIWRAHREKTWQIAPSSWWEGGVQRGSLSTVVGAPDWWDPVPPPSKSDFSYMLAGPQNRISTVVGAPDWWGDIPKTGILSAEGPCDLHFSVLPL
jgi:hypothetical protein